MAAIVNNAELDAQQCIVVVSGEDCRVRLVLCCCVGQRDVTKSCAGIVECIVGHVLVVKHEEGQNSVRTPRVPCGACVVEGSTIGFALGQACELE